MKRSHMIIGIVLLIIIIALIFVAFNSKKIIHVFTGEKGEEEGGEEGAGGAEGGEPPAE